MAIQSGCTIQSDDLISIGAHYGMSSSQGTTTGGWTVLNFDQKDYDTHNAVITGASWHFVCPIGGYYLVRVLWISQSISWAAGAALNLQLYKNGVQADYLAQMEQDATLTLYKPAQGAAIIKLAVNDSLDVRLNQNTGSTVYNYSSSTQNIIAIQRIGAS